MNSEELELSLKSDFENYLNDLFAEMKQNAAALQQNFEAEFEKHKSQVDEAIRLFSERFENSPRLNEAFSQSVSEHLRLAKDSGAELAAVAFSEAEKLAENTVVPAAYDRLRDAINDISSRSSQSTILGALVHHAAQFAPRGVFFLAKTDGFVGWKRFGNGMEAEDLEPSNRFDLSGDSVLATAVRELRTVQGTFSEEGPDSEFVNALSLGRPDRMYAIPLVARGRGVAVMYADYGTEGTTLNVEALETLVRVAGLTVELLAATQQPAPVATQPVSSEVQTEHPVSSELQTDAVQGSDNAVYETPEPAAEYVHYPEAEVTYEVEAESEEMTADSPQQYSSEETAGDFDPQDHHEPRVEIVSDPYHAIEAGSEPQPVEFLTDENDAVPAVSSGFEPVFEHGAVSEAEGEPEMAGEPEIETGYGSHESFSDANAVNAEAEAEVEFVEQEDEEASAEPVTSEFAFSSSNDIEDSRSFSGHDRESEPVGMPETEVAANGFQMERSAVPVVEVPAAPTRTRFGDRNMDLPIEVADDERRLHNDARRFARLLVSEIKLYNEEKVREGREAGDLYDRLKEAVDRSREMYDKRVQPAVAAKFDYFHYELVNSLAEGQEGRLGGNYKGAVV